MDAARARRGARTPGGVRLTPGALAVLLAIGSVAAASSVGAEPAGAEVAAPAPSEALPPVGARTAPVAASEPLWVDAPSAVPRAAGPRDLAPVLRTIEASVVRLSVAGAGDAVRRSRGTGFVISATGYLVTSTALPRGGALRVSVGGSRELPVEVVGRDPNTEVALLRVDPERVAAEGVELVPAPFGTSTGLRVGDEVLTVGHGDDDGSSAARGVVAGRDRRIAPLGQTGSRFIRLEMLLAPGFGGAPLVDGEGRVVGLISGERMAKADFDTIAFAVPIEAAKAVIPELAHSGQAPTGWLGVQILPLEQATADELGLGDGGGALVTEVLKGSPAERAELRQGDVIVEFDGQRVRTSRDLTVQVGRTLPGSEVALIVLRGGARRRLRAVIEPRELEARRLVKAAGLSGPAAGWGFDCAELTRDVALRYSLPDSTRGIVVDRLDAGGPAQLSGLQLGDAVLEINGEPLTSLGRLEAALRGKEPLILLIRRGEHTRFVDLYR